MLHFWKHLLRSLAWLLISELLCLILAFSFAILSFPWIRYVSLICGMLAHCLLIASCAKTIAHEDFAAYRAGAKISPAKPFLLALGTALPLWAIYTVMLLNAESSALLNAFLLLNAPYIQLHRLILNGTEPFSALSSVRQFLCALPPLITAAAFVIGYQRQYLPEKADLAVRSSNSR